jgi:molybdenum cofactor biosynthesis enzyme MoaA
MRSSPRAPLRIERVRRIAAEAAELGVGEIFVIGGKPLMPPDIGEIIFACATTTPVAVLTRDMLFRGGRPKSSRSLPRERVTLQIKPR